MIIRPIGLRILTQLNRGEGRHRLARKCFHGQWGELRQRYQEGQEDQLGALGLVVNAPYGWHSPALGIKQSGPVIRAVCQGAFPLRMATMFEVSGIGDSRMPARIPLPAGNAIRVILSADKHDLSVTISRTTVRICAVTWRLEPETEMPARPQWLLRVPDILAELSALEVPVVDRSIIESAFRVKRRRAIYLLGWFGGYQVGRTFLVERDSLLRQLRQIAAGERFDYEKRRHERLTESLARVRRELQAANVVIPVPEQTPQPAGLPDGVTLETGRLLVEFSSVEDLLGKLYGIAQAAAGDFAAFEAAAGGASHRLAVEIP